MKRISAIALVALALGLLTHAAAPPVKRGDIPDFIEGAEGLEDALRNLKASMVTTPSLSPAKAREQFHALPGMAIDLIGAEPAVKQPLYIAFDERGRMWVTQYRQYPFPAGLKVVKYDRYIRAQFDKVPPPPPNHFKGEDRITIHEDTKGNGTFDKVTTFLDGLNIATAALPGRGGVWVMNPPYLLYYPMNKDGSAGTPVVHLSGFGLEDTHAVASSLCWGPDGWLYGAQGSTCTAKVRVEVSKDKKTTDFLGQAIWRYHPTDHRFEIFAEGGGNTFGVAFDDVGRVYSGTNWGKYRGLHYVQGGYYIKGWGKHGPLTNPYALGYFDHMPHEGNADRLTHTFIVYGESAIPSLRGKIVGVNSLQNRLTVTSLIPDKSTFRTKEEPYLLTTEDKRFRPVDVKAGPDGALYIADLYEPRINHVDPRDNWDKATGRIWRVRPSEYKAAPRRDLAKATSKELVALLGSERRWDRDMALRLLGERKDKAVVPQLKKNLKDGKGHFALGALWALNLCDELDGDQVHVALEHSDAHVRRWTIRLIGDGKALGEFDYILDHYVEDEEPEVRSQLASTAKRIQGDGGVLLAFSLVDNNKNDVGDPHIPLLIWWAIESKAETERKTIVELLTSRGVRTHPIIDRFVIERIMQRWAMAGGKENLLACAKLLDATDKDAGNLLTGLEKGFAGRSVGEIPPELRKAVFAAWKRGNTEAKLSLGLRLGHEPAIKNALSLIVDDKADRKTRLDCIRILGEIMQPGAADALLRTARTSKLGAVRAEAIASLNRYNEGRVGVAVLEMFRAGLPEVDGVRTAALSLLTSRPAWAALLLKDIAEKKITPQAIPTDIVQKLALIPDKAIAALVTKHFGKVRGTTPADKAREMLRVGKLLKAGKSDAISGSKVYETNCGKCHKLFGTGGEVGPDLTGYERTNALYWMENIIDPSAVIREEYMMFVVQTTDGRTLSGLVAGQDKTTVTIRDSEGRNTKIDRKRIEEMHASPVSIMPEGQLKALKDQEIRDLFAYLMSKTKP